MRTIATQEGRAAMTRPFRLCLDGPDSKPVRWLRDVTGVGAPSGRHPDKSSPLFSGILLRFMRDSGIRINS